MGIFSRWVQLVRSNMNHLLGRAENAEKMLNQVVSDMNDQLIVAKKQIAGAIADERRLAKQLEQEQERGIDWEKRAMLALTQGDDALAREALSRKREHDKLASSYQEQWSKQKVAVEQLKVALTGLNDKIEEAKRKKNLLIARKARAEAQKTIQETLGGLSDSTAFETFGRMEAKIERIEAEAEAHAELTEHATGDALAAKFAKLEQDAGSDDDLLALKRKMGLLPPEPRRVAALPLSTESRDRESVVEASAELY